MRYTFADIEINLTAGIIIKAGEKINVRAKTLLVLTYLIQHPKDIVTKKTLIETIWHDVVVQDQVLVQSIKEIRAILGNEVIKTYPRVGYQWTVELTPIPTKKGLALTQLSKKNTVSLITVLVFLITLLVTQIANLSPKDDFSNKNDAITVGFLPINNDMPDDIHDWVTTTGTHYLNQRLQQQSSLLTFDTTKLLSLLSEHNNSPNTLFDSPLTPQNALLADVIVKTRLLGYPQDFQLHYSLYNGKTVEHGVEFASSVEQALDQLVEKVAIRFDTFKAINSQVVYHPFSNEAFARGITLYLAGEYIKATAFFASASQSNPNLLVARRYLAACYIKTNKLAEGITLIQKNIESAKKAQAFREEIRSNLLIGVSLLHWYQANNSLDKNQLLQATHYIESAKALAENHHDLLFIAYAYEELGAIERIQQNYPQAITLQKSALAVHQRFRGNYGQTRALIGLARIAHEQGNQQLSDEYFNKALVIAQRNGVVTNEIQTLLAQATIKISQGLAQQAQSIASTALTLASKSANNQLVSQVIHWFDVNDKRINY
jgi:DNA-binding winged helix-turn-helix (wHTH) protein/tetratricopeptide (TPR) repeat protein